MSNKTKAELITQAEEIKNETIQGANTANRVGTMFNDLIDSTTSGGGIYAMDLDNDTFAIQNAGVYYVASYPSHGITFPDPVNFDGQIIYVVNTSNENADIINNGNSPRSLDNTLQNNVPTQTTFCICSINGKWIIILQYTV